MHWDRELARRYYPDLKDSAWSERFIYALPELNREGLRVASHVAGPGCLATAALLGLYPLAVGGLLTGPVVIEAKVGSTAAGASPGPGDIHFSATAVELVRGCW